MLIELPVFGGYKSLWQIGRKPIRFDGHAVGAERVGLQQVIDGGEVASSPTDKEDRGQYNNQHER